MEKYIGITDTPIGIVRIVSDGKYIREISVSGKASGEVPDALCKRMIREIKEYFSGKRTEFSVPVMPEGTDFQKSVWRELAKIPYGETRTYGQIATLLGNKKLARAVGGAVGANPLLIVIPCHRVFASDGFGGFSCGLQRKKILCERENITVPDIDKCRLLR